jgi:parvulin-like peptidyl-prolyl isomerase
MIDADKNLEDCPACTKEKAESALLELRSGAEFRTVAQRYSGDILEPMKSKWVVRGNHEKDFEETLFSLDVGEVNSLHEKEGAFYIVKVLEKQPGRFKSYHEIKNSLTREYQWQKGEDYLKQNRDRILFTINGKPYTIGDFLNVYQRENPPHQCHHMEGMDHKENMKKPQQLCDFAHNDIEDQKKLVDRMIDGELIVEDTYNQMIHVEHQREIEFVTMASLYPIFHREEMEKLIRITDEMVAEYYQKEKKAYMYPAKANLSMILIKGGETEEDKNRAFEKAQKTYKELKPPFYLFRKGKDFAEIARKYSEHNETAAKGGRLEVDVYECRNAIDYMLFHGFHKEIFSLNPGDISDVFEFENNYYIIQIREMEKRKQIDFEEIREQVKKDLIAKEHQKVMEGWEDDLLESAGFAIYDQALEEALAEGMPGEQRKSRGT